VTPEPVDLGGPSVPGPLLGGAKLVVIAGPCVLEDEESAVVLAIDLATRLASRPVRLVFKASFDKANRTSRHSFRGPGFEAGLRMLGAVRRESGLPVLTDIHQPEQAEEAAAVVDVLQVPAFLCRQTDLLEAAGRTGKPVNIKKAQFLAPEDMRHVIAKVERAGNRRILLTERGTCFGYNNLVADMRSLCVMRASGYPVIFDATHSVQRPGAADGASGGDAQWAPALARAAVAVGCDAVFIETYPAPERALSDGANAIPLRKMRGLWRTLRSINDVVA